MASKIVLKDVTKVFQTRARVVPALDRVSLEVADGEFVCVVGPSGCGKSTLLRILAGLVPQTSGEVVFNTGGSGKPLHSLVFQEYAIFPWKTVLQNVLFGLEMRGVPRAERETAAQAWIERVGLRGFADAYPRQLSGGMRQRVGIARAFVNDPEVLLMDEPMGALDAQTRLLLMDELLRLWEADRKTVVYITHDIEEAVLLGDRVVLMTARPGRPKATFTVPFARPRDIALMASPEFARLSYEIWEALRDEAIAAMAATA
ncbi:MAG: mannosyltransferase [Armatimonadetes bacterium RBG_16_67_12]|nr:MAG: mannosyltransferase [Armatimonadetes bacterium RBG_16_67_12]